MKHIKVRNVWGVSNQLTIQTEKGRYFQSYDSIIVFVPFETEKKSKTQLDEKFWDYSRTTGKYRNLFLGEDKKETEKKIKSGEYVLVDLN